MKNKGITLIALVVTVIVLLILAGISISMLAGNNSILQKATDAKTETERGEVYEQISLATASGEMDYYSNGTDRLTAYKNALLNGVEGIDRDNLTDNSSNLITGTVTTKSGKKYDFSVPVPVTDITIAEHEEKVIELTSVYAKLYNDGTLILSSTDYTDSSKTLTKDFGMVENKSANNYWSASDYNTLVTKVSFYDEIVPSTTAYYFNNLTNLTTFENMNNLETSLVTDMKYMFAGCGSLTAIDVSKFDTSNVTNMSYMFAGNCNVKHGPPYETYYYVAHLQELDLSSFDTKNVTDMSCMFMDQIVIETINLDKFDTSKVQNMYSMFENCVSLKSLNLKSFNTGNVTNMSSMFDKCISLTELDLTCFDTKRVSNMSLMFKGMYKAYQGSDLYYYNEVRRSGTEMKIKKIYVSELWNTDNVSFRGYNNTLGYNMFYNCPELSGAIAYDENKTSLEYANYETGYLTYKSNT